MYCSCLNKIVLPRARFSTRVTDSGSSSAPNREPILKKARDPQELLPSSETERERERGGEREKDREKQRDETKKFVEI